MCRFSCTAPQVCLHVAHARQRCREAVRLLRFITRASSPRIDARGRRRERHTPLIIIEHSSPPHAYPWAAGEAELEAVAMVLDGHVDAVVSVDSDVPATMMLHHLATKGRDTEAMPLVSHNT